MDTIKSVEKLLKLASTLTQSAGSGIIFNQSANKSLVVSVIAKFSLSLIVTAIFGPSSSCEKRLEADEMLELDSKTVLVVDSWEERVGEGEFRYFGLEFRMRRRFEEGFEGAAPHVRRRFVVVLGGSVEGVEV
jgi:hypothetical protein